MQLKIKEKKHSQLPSQEPSMEHPLQERGAANFRVHSSRAETRESRAAHREAQSQPPVWLARKNRFCIIILYIYIFFHLFLLVGG